MSFRIFPIHDIIRIMFIRIVNGGIINGQAKTIVLSMLGAVGIQTISTGGGHTLRGNHAINGAVGNTQRIRPTIDAIIEIVR